ncbi:hypothetical protein BASA62_006814 [Batrachochytrium salamandrivorans]|nr:hypothetical protein BASA62_006814 [Batrachochytrium salamandrivorans]
MEKPEQTEQPPPKRIIIIGGGVAGLSLALGIRQMSQLHSLNLQPVIYEATTTYTDRGQHLLLWKWAVEGLLDLGLGKRLGCISWPIVKLLILELALELLLGTGTGTTTGSTTTTTATGAGILGSTFSSHSGRVPYSDKEKDMDPEAGVHVTTDMPALDDHAYLPPLLGLRKP